MATYDPKKVSIMVDGFVVTGFMDGSMIKAERLTEKRSVHTGADGKVDFVKSANDAGRVTFYLKQTSPANGVLDELYYQDTPFPFSAIDGNFPPGNVGVSGIECVVETKPPWERADTMKGVEWKLLVANLDSIFKK